MDFNIGVGGPARVDISDKTDSNHDRLHGRHGSVVAVSGDGADEETGDARGSRLYCVRLDGGDTADVRWRDLWPPLKKE